MKKKLLLLEELQTIDAAIQEKKAEQATHQAGIEKLGQAVAELRDMQAADQSRLSELMREKQELETSVQVEQDNIKRSESHMKEIRTNKEYQAVGREIAAARKLMSEIEEQILQKSVQIDELQGAIDLRATELQALDQSTGTGLAEFQSAIQLLQGDIDAAITKREVIVKGLSTSVVRRYTQLRDQRRGQALAEARDGSCTGCNINLPPQLYNTLFKGDDLHYCPHCQRILVLKQEPQQAQE